LDLGSEKPAGLVTALATRPGAQPGTTPWPERCLDIVLTLIVMPVLVLVGAALAAAIYIDSPGPVLYRSRRVGRDGRPFDMLKFRKMRREAPSHPVTLPDDERFTPIGRFLAATRLDELPQVINVLRGEMRLVGPRPELQYFTDQYADEYAEILTVTPGITGNAQLMFVDESARLTGPSPAALYVETVMPEKIAVDLDYVRHHSPARDLSILARTVALPAVLVLQHLRARSAVARLWAPTVLAAALLASAFLIVSSHLP
jgi:lipopolysaccharide/colanic/teichoic acid biosynthesis glycosyltransferase